MDLSSISLEMLDDPQLANYLMKQAFGEDFERDPEEWVPPTSYKKSLTDEPDATTTFEQLAAENGFET